MTTSGLLSERYSKESKCSVSKLVNRTDEFNYFLDCFLLSGLGNFVVDCGVRARFGQFNFPFFPQ